MTLSFTMLCQCYVYYFIFYNAKRHYAECRYAKCRYAKCRSIECHNAECRYAGCRGALSKQGAVFIKIIFTLYSFHIVLS
jgi:hypothetical protein